MSISDFRNYISKQLQKLFEQEETKPAVMGMHALSESDDPTKDQLEQKLLSIGGNIVMLGLDTEEERLRMINDGEVYQGAVSKMSGMPNRCHSNVACYYKTFEPKGFKIITGYALNEGMWIQHTWGKLGDKIIETTPLDWEIYYGYELNPREAQSFYFDNY